MAPCAGQNPTVWRSAGGTMVFHFTVSSGLASWKLALDPLLLRFFFLFVYVHRTPRCFTW